jgi:ELWxxDGT repeat protein
VSILRILWLLIPTHVVCRAGQVLITENLGGPALHTTGDGVSADAAVLNDVLYFAASDSFYYGHGGELWRSDGTAEGTWMVKDTVPGSAGIGGSGFTTVGSKVFFVATDPVAGKELCVTDGTAAGTQMVRDITAGSGGSTIERLTALGGRLLFRTTTAAAGTELWISDGTSAGTGMLKDINPGTMAP